MGGEQKPHVDPESREMWKELKALDLRDEERGGEEKGEHCGRCHAFKGAVITQVHSVQGFAIRVIATSVNYCPVCGAKL